MTILREYQKRVCRLIVDHFQRKPNEPALAVMPTGAGKTQVFSAIAKYVTLLDPANEVLVLAHRQELVSQAEKRLKEVMPDTTIGVWCGGLKRKERAPVMVGTIQSLTELEKWPKLVIIDEAHNINDEDEGRYRTLLRDAPEGTLILGVTATPFRLSGGSIVGEDKFFPTVTARVSMVELIERNYLVRPRLVGAGDEYRVNTDGVEIRNGDYVTSQLMANYSDTLLANQVGHALVRLEQRHSAVWFCLTIEQAERCREMIDAAGQTVAVVHSRMPIADRDMALRGFGMGQYKHLVNVAVLTEGWDEPRTDAIVLLRPTVSPVFYVQSVGRGMRPYTQLNSCTGPSDGWTKTDCLILDYGGVVERLGTVDNPQLNAKKSGKGDGDAPLKICSSCWEYVPTASRNCPECDFEFPAPVAKGNPTAASGMGMLSGEQEITTVRVQTVNAYEHVSKKGNHCIRLEYQTSAWQTHAEYLMFDLDFQAKAARKRLDDLGVEAHDLAKCVDTKSAMEVLREMGGLFVPEAIRMKRDGKYWRIVECVMWMPPAEREALGFTDKPAVTPQTAIPF